MVYDNQEQPEFCICSSGHVGAGCQNCTLGIIMQPIWVSRWRCSCTAACNSGSGHHPGSNQTLLTNLVSSWKHYLLQKCQVFVKYSVGATDGRWDFPIWTEKTNFYHSKSPNQEDRYAIQYLGKFIKTLQETVLCCWKHPLQAQSSACNIISSSRNTFCISQK